jgi:hypothetical protein
VLCHQSVLKNDVTKTQNLNPLGNPGKGGKNYKSINLFDEAQLDFANSFKYNYHSRKRNIITIEA